MQLTYLIKGITCQACIQKVLLVLNQFGLNDAKIDMSSKILSLDVDDMYTAEKINLVVINSELAKIGNYEIVEMNRQINQINNGNTNNKGESDSNKVASEEEKLSYKPIYIIFVYLIITVLAIRFKSSSQDLMINFMAGFF